MNRLPLRPIRRIALCIALSILPSCASLQELPSSLSREGQPVVVDASEIAALVPRSEPRVIERASELGYDLIEAHPLPSLQERLLIFRIPEGGTIPEAIADLEAAIPGSTVGANHLYQTQVESSASPLGQYANALIGWPQSGCVARQSVGMVDAGLPPNSPLIRSGQVKQSVFHDGPAIPTTRHGADMAQIIAGPGRLRGTTLFSANVVSPTQSGATGASVVAILRGVEWLRSQNVRVINMSLAGPRNKLLNRALGAAAADGSVFVAAAGNNGASAPPQYPAAFPFVVAATAVDADSRAYSRAVRGEHIDFAAPGVDIVVMDEGSTRVVTGTSAAAAFVSAAIAADPGLRSANVEVVRQRLAGRTTDLGQPGADGVFGDGLISAPAACGTPNN